MKIECSCGARYEFEVTPDMAGNQLELTCQRCGSDLSPALNQAVRAHFRGAAAPASTARSHASGPVRASVHAPSEAPVAPTFGAAGAATLCSRHALATVDTCRICGKPICPKCMELFSYVCSPLCREAAEKQGLALPVYERQREVVQARENRKLRHTALAAAGVVVLLLGVWAWYGLIASQPHPVYSVPLADSQFDGELRFVPPNDVVILRGRRLMRYDVHAKKEVWSVALREAGESPLHWQAQGREVWVAQGRELIQYDWTSGQPAREIALPGPVELFFADDAEMRLLTRTELGRQAAIQVNMRDGAVQQEIVTQPASSSTNTPGVSAGFAVARPGPVRPGGGRGPPAIQAARALQLMADQRDFGDDDATPAWRPLDQSRSEVVGGPHALVQLTVKLLEAKTSTVQAMKPPPERSALDGPVNAAATVAIVNETLNEMQRNRTGGVEQEDVSRYGVSLKRLMTSEAREWSGEVTGPPELFPLRTVDVLVAGKNLAVLDKSGQRLWETTLAYAVPAIGPPELLMPDDHVPAGPCVERDETLLVFDLGVLSAFDRATGQARWRLPSVGIRGLRFDDAGMLYVNTTDAEQDQVKHRQQIQIERRVRPLILKVEPRSGKILWQARNYGWLAKVSGKFAYALEWSAGPDQATQRLNEVPAHLRLYRLDLDDGTECWQHYQRREPIAIDFCRNTIAILFKQELQVLRFTSF